MEARDERHQSQGHDSHPQASAHSHDRKWSDETFVGGWTQREEANLAALRPQLAKVRSLIPKGPTEPFRYVDLGAGVGYLDELILDRFTGAHAVLIDGSAPLLALAQKRLQRYAGRVQFVQADLSGQQWVEQVRGSFDAVVSARALHHLGGAARIRELFAEVLGTLTPGGLFINLDYVRLSNAVLQPLGLWAMTDPDSDFQTVSPPMELTGSMEEQLAWLREAGFSAAECVVREFQTAILVSLRDQVCWPTA